MENTQLEKTIRLIHSKSGHHKTVLHSSDLMYNVVTRVNYMTILLWIEYINTIIKSKPELKLEPFTKPNWLVMIKSYRRDFELRLNK